MRFSEKHIIASSTKVNSIKQQNEAYIPSIQFFNGFQKKCNDFTYNSAYKNDMQNDVGNVICLCTRLKVNLSFFSFYKSIASFPMHGDKEPSIKEAFISILLICFRIIRSYTYTKNPSHTNQ